jgi:hypothetical protein
MTTSRTVSPRRGTFQVGEDSVWSRKGPRVPEISRFYGIRITMYRGDHGPAHFHVKYGDHRAKVNLGDGRVTGQLPPRALRFVREWHRLHVDELVANWDLASRCQPLLPIQPLE